MDGKQGYDVLGFIYEYLIENFAENAVKKAGEFYTTHEISLLMSEIVANHLKDRGNIEIYNPRSGSRVIIMTTADSNGEYWVSNYLLGKQKIDLCAFSSAYWT